jgi:hypothetical protein
MSSAATQRAKTRATAPASDIATPPLEHKRIARLAYAYWEARGRPDGSPEEDWFRAEAELRRRQAAWKVKREQSRRTPRRARITAQRRKSAR